MQWTEFELKVKEYEEKWPMVPVIMGGGCLLGILIGAATCLPLICVFWFIAIVAGLIYENSIALTCPYCGRRINKGSKGRDSEILILKNMKQCPHCQEKFQ